MLAEQPALRDDDNMMQAYVFLMDFLESFSDVVGGMVRENQALLKELLEAAKESEDGLDQYVQTNRAKVRHLLCLLALLICFIYIFSMSCEWFYDWFYRLRRYFSPLYSDAHKMLFLQLLDPNFFVYLDTELASSETGGPAHSLLLTVHLRLMEERAKRYAYTMYTFSVLVLPALPTGDASFGVFSLPIAE